jgi:hypothetical protein
MRRGGSQRISSTEVFRVVPHAPRWSGPRHALVHRIGPTRRTSPGRGRQALLICLKPAIRGSSPPSIVNDAPRTIGRSGFLKADDGRKHTKDEQENPHGNLQSRSGLSRQNVLKLQIAIQVVYSRLRDDPRGRQVAGVSALLWPAAVVPICVYETSAVQTFYRLARFPK